MTPRPLPARLRTHDELFCRLHGIEQDADNVLVAVMERHDGQAELVDPARLRQINQYYAESFRDPGLSAARRAELAEEHALIDDALGLLNDLRTAAHPPKPQQAFAPVAASRLFPASIEAEAAALWQQVSGKPLARQLREGPVQS